MKSYILQIHTGSFMNRHTDIQEIKEKMDPIVLHNHIKAVIFGWNLDNTLNQSILDYFHQHHIPCYFWLPVLSEVDLIKDASAMIDYTGKQGNQVQVIEDESFSFLCPSDLKNFHNIQQIYEEHLSQLSFDGIFLDKIRFPSFANGYNEGFGCFCEQCQNRYGNEGIDLHSLKSKIDLHDATLLKGHYDDYGHYCFDDENVDLFYKTRSKIISTFVGNLCDYFHQKKLKVGLDIYAPFFAYHCGQDIYKLSQKADFLKPMFYRFTQAPAGMHYEYDAYIKNFDQTDYFEFDPISMENLQLQTEFLRNAKCDVYPGIEINPIDDICEVDKDKFLESRDFFQQHFETIVCCWNCLLMGKEIEEIFLR